MGALLITLQNMVKWWRECNLLSLPRLFDIVGQSGKASFAIQEHMETLPGKHYKTQVRS